MFIKLSTIFQKGTDDINEVSRLKNDNFTVRPEMHVHACCRKNYISTPGVTSSSAEVSYKKTRTSPDGSTSPWLYYYSERKGN